MIRKLNCKFIESKNLKKLNKMEKLKPCPFCGQEVEIVRTKSEGVDGVSYHISHDYRDAWGCPIATHEGEFLGTNFYKTKKELIESWNSRQC